MTVPWRRDPEVLRARIGAWLRHAVPTATAVEVGELAAPQGSGMSSETLLVDLGWTAAGVAHAGGYVLRLEPDRTHLPVFPVYDLTLQRRCMELVGTHTDVPVPAVPFEEPDPEWLGAPFLVMARIDGVAPADLPPYVREGWLAEGSEADRRRLEHHAIDVLARLHRLTPDTADLSFLDRPAFAAEPLDQYLVATRRHYEWARADVHYPLVERALDWLEEHRPAPGPTVCNWGDARIGNILWRDFAPVAVLDWEMAALGPAEVDLSWMLWLHRFFQDLTERMGAPGLPGMFDRARSIATYESASGQRVRDLEWFDVLSATRHAVITVRTTMRSVAFGAPPPATPDAAIHFRHLLAAMLDGTYWDRA